MPVGSGAPGRGPGLARFRSTALSTTTLSTTTGTEWDVFRMLPGTDPPVYLATLYEAREKTIRVELNGSGAGQFAINRTSPECTDAILAQGNLVKVRIPEIYTGYIFAFFLESGDFTLISSQEAGGEMLTFGGRGILSYLEYARAWSESYITGGQDPIAGVWRAYAAGTGSAPGQILRRLIEEFQDPDRPQAPVPHLTVDFDYDNDSTVDPWDTTDATDEFAYQVGEDGLAILLRLLETKTIIVQIDPDFLLSAYNINNYGRDLAGNFGAGVVRFERGVNIATELRRELAVTEVATHILVQGEADAYGTSALSDAVDRVTKEAFLAAFGTGATALAGIGAVELQARLNRSDLVQFPIANRRTANVMLADPVSTGGSLGPLAVDGYYLPGPEGTFGDFWVGDTVRVHTGYGTFDYPEVNAKVLAITITRDDANHELIVIPELEILASVVDVCGGFGVCQRFNTGYSVAIPDCAEVGDTLIGTMTTRGGDPGDESFPAGWTLADHLKAGVQGPGKPPTCVAVYWRVREAGDPGSIIVQPGNPGTETFITVLKNAGPPTTITSGTDTVVKGGSAFIGPTAGGGTLWGAMAFQRGDAGNHQEGFALDVDAITYTISPAGSTFAGDCGVSWAEHTHRRWIGIASDTAPFTMGGTMTDGPGPYSSDSPWARAWIGLYFA